jgi:cytochrome c biogenesis protein CcmG/thiol:disulfide interchange protein DsbE
MSQSNMEAERHMSELVEHAPVEKQTRKRKRRLLIICGICLLNAGLLALLLTQLLTPASKHNTDPFVGHAAPNFSLAMVRPSGSQSAISLAHFKGKAVVLNFWASWCAPCQEEAPLLENAWKQAQAQGKALVFLGIDFQETSGDAARFLQSTGITYPAAIDADGSVAAKYGVTSLPVTVFIDHNGIIASRETREITAQVLTNDLKLIAS